MLPLKWWPGVRWHARPRGNACCWCALLFLVAMACELDETVRTTADCAFLRPPTFLGAPAPTAAAAAAAGLRPHAAQDTVLTRMRQSRQLARWVLSGDDGLC
ncbi:hypothetical protein Zmor_007781 [Zophobas morio]|uniref:Secreted protein n=1 Tax=Zophobas morio TaxID=2755281 RepID=A0AA38IU65_9CUCU|nr:hypothetical protein Zmor_007781 [Zophobas morio]